MNRRKVYVKKAMSEPIYKKGELLGYKEHTADGLVRELDANSNKYEIVFV